jgi:asparagine synthase (glutamine-hydrolysing)
MSEPLGDASLIPTYALAAFARKQVIVSLSGDGGDELFAGYDPFLALGPASLYSRIIPRGFHRLIKKMVNILPPGDANMSLDFKIKRMLRGLSYNKSYRLPVWMSPLEPSEIRELFMYPLSEEELYEDAVSIWETNDTLNDVDKALLFFTRLYLPNDILVKVDRATTMVSMESRAVFLDNDLVDFCTRLPNQFKLRGTCRKYLLKRALHGWIPDKILSQPKKGFGIPLNRWLRSIECPQIPVNIKQEKVNAKWDAHRRRKGDHRLFLWSAIALENMQTRA